MRRQIACLLLAALLTGCCKNGISVQNQYFSRDDLASHIMDTPDPERNCPPIGQRLIVQWKFPHQLVEQGDLSLLMTVRLRDYSEENFTIPITRSHGIYLYELCNQRYFDTCGVATYKIETWSCGELIDVWKHQLWIELITIDTDNDNDVFDSEKIDFDE